MTEQRQARIGVIVKYTDDVKSMACCEVWENGKFVGGAYGPMAIVHCGLLADYISHATAKDGNPGIKYIKPMDLPS